MTEQQLPESYLSSSDILFNVDTRCTACSFGSADGSVVHSVYPNDINNARLVVILDYPNELDLLNYACFPDEENRKEKVTRNYIRLEKRRNGANILRYFIQKYLKIDHQEEVIYINSFKCPPKDKTVLDKHVRTCARKWLEKEFSIIDTFVPSIPVFVAGSTALKALKVLEPNLKNYNLNSLRSTTGHQYRNHPLVFSFSPGSCANAQSRIEKDMQLQREGWSKVISFDNLPLVWGSPLWIFQKDFLILKQFFE